LLGGLAGQRWRPRQGTVEMIRAAAIVAIIGGVFVTWEIERDLRRLSKW
tara:strand:+ start:24473 stop:24619 length:147 start_codon:yes stop_codon:yes gene_type:complete